MGPDLREEAHGEKATWTLSLRPKGGHGNDCDTLDLQPRDGVL
jgi:hypothetical protein